LLEDLRNDGVTIILTTHYIEEAEKICSRVAILNQGKLLAEGTPKFFCAGGKFQTLEDFFVALTEKAAL